MTKVLYFNEDDELKIGNWDHPTFTIDSIIDISTHQPENLRDVIIRRFQNFCFRRVAKISATLPSKSSKKIFVDPDGKICTEETEGAILIGEEERYTKFHGFTSNYTLRTEGDTNIGKNLYFSSSTECDLNEWGLLVPIPPFRRGIPPKKDQLICGVISTVETEKCVPYQRWFKCSEQFYKTLTTIRDKSHPSNQNLSIGKIFQKVETNILRLSLEKRCDPPTLINEQTESYSKISHFYQFLLNDCVFQNIVPDWNEISKSKYFRLHREMYLLFKKRMLWMNGDELCDIDYKNLPTIE